MKGTSFLSKLSTLFLFLGLFAALPVFSQDGEKITGKVVDGSGEPLIGVSVIIQGTTSGGVTDLDGNFNVPAKPGQLLTFSYIGYVTKVLPAKSGMSVTLAEDNKVLDEVVVVGYGTMKKSDVTGAISSVKSTDLANRSTSNAAAALQGKVSGVQVINNSGAPGQAPTIRVRGYSSNGKSDPLYIVDGLKVADIGYLDAENIESMEVLKDAASAAIYGAEAGNGVILITTKSGKKGDGKINFSSQFSITSLAKKAKVLNAADYIQYETEANSSFKDLLDKYYYNEASATINGKLADTDWQDEVYEHGHRQRYNVSFEGGNDNGNLFVSLGYQNNNGIVRYNSDTFEQFNAQVKGSYNIKKWLEIGTTISMEKNTTRALDEGSYLYSPTAKILNLDPLTPFEYSGGLTGASTWVQSAYAAGLKPVVNSHTGEYYGVSAFSGMQNPIAGLEKNDEKTTNQRTNGTFYLNFKPIKNLVFTSRFGFRMADVNYYRYLNGGYISFDQTSYEDRLEEKKTIDRYYQWENFANYMFNVKKNNFTVMAGMSYIKDVTSYDDIVTNQLTSSESNFRYMDYSATTANDVVAGTTNKRVQIAYYGRFGWEYDGRYNVLFNFRADSYDAAYLDLDHNWGYFPSVSAGWTFSNEKFFENLKWNWLTSGKLRASYGKNGSISNLGGYMYATTLQSGTSATMGGISLATYNYYMNGKLYTGTYPSAYLANPSLKWEESKQFDLGLDLRFLNGRLNVNMDYYNKNTTGLLVMSAAPLITGAKYMYQNLGKVNNHGFEFEAEWRDRIGDFNYGIKGNIATVSNKVTKYKGEGTRIAGVTVRQNGIPVSYFEEGYPLWYLRGYQVDHIDATTGAPIYKDNNGDGSITDDDRVQIGKGIPDFTYGITLTASYKNFDLMVYGSGAQGLDLMYGVSSSSEGGLKSNKPQFLFDDRWTTTNTNAKYAAPVYQIDDKYLDSDAFIFNGSYFKIKQIQLGYTIPKSLLKKISIDNCRLYMSLDDFFTFTSYPGSDPELRSQSQVSALGVDFGGTPIAKSVMFGLNLTF
jgi:TonB-linked SusC/RagA family outer membrane protein